MSCRESGGICKGDFQGALTLFVLQSTGFCNINCDYCYLAGRDDRRVMSDEVLEASIKGIFESVFSLKRFTICWHAGEPLAAGIDHYKRALDYIDKHNFMRAEIILSVQTNATLINDEWARFFKEHHFQVGVSLDGPQRIHDAHRVKRSGGGTFAETIRGIEFLKKYDVPFHVISVVTPDSLINPNDFYDFFEGLGIKNLGLNVEESDGENTHGAFGSNVLDAQLREFILGLCSVWRERRYSIAIREFGFYYQLLKEKGYNRTSPQDAAPFSIVNVSIDGDFSTFSPEMLGVETSYGNFNLGNIMEMQFDDAVYSSKFQSILRDVEIGAEMCASECEYFPVCGGGVPSNKYFENGSLKTTRTRSCETNVKMFADAVLDMVESS